MTQRRIMATTTVMLMLMMMKKKKMRSTPTSAWVLSDVLHCHVQAPNNKVEKECQPMGEMHGCDPALFTITITPPPPSPPASGVNSDGLQGRVLGPPGVQKFLKALGFFFAPSLLVLCPFSWDDGFRWSSDLFLVLNVLWGSTSLDLTEFST